LMLCVYFGNRAYTVAILKAYEDKPTASKMTTVTFSPSVTHNP